MTDELAGLPDEVRAVIARPQIEKKEVLAELGLTIAGMRDEAVSARAESGIETTWKECEEAYIGIDDENRSEFAGARWAKPTTMEGPVQRVGNSSDGVKATAYVKLAARYVDAGTAKVCEIALPIDGKPFALKATPVPELAGALEDQTPAQQVTGMPMPGKDGQPVSVGELAKHQLSEAEKKAEKAGNRIHDWMVEYKHAAEMRKIIFDGARLGVGVLKGPIPEKRKATVVRRDANGLFVEIVKQIKPAARWVDPWRFYPAPGCGEDIHKGGHCFEEDLMLAGELLALRDQDGYIREAIDKVIKEGPGKINDTQNNPEKTPHKKQFQVWHMYGKVPARAFQAANEVQGQEIDETEEKVFAIVTLVNDTVIRAVLNPMDSGRLPYHVFNWRRRQGHWAGVGVAEQVRTPGRIVTAATRALLNNAGKSSGAQVVMDPATVEPADGSHAIVGDKLWWLRKSSGVDDVRKVFAAFNWPNTTEQLMRVIEYGFKLAEEHSSIPLITQGQSGDTTPDTFSGQQLQDNNANQLLRDVGFGLNDQITTPLVDQFYEWLLLDPEVPEDEKGDYQIDTSGAMSLIEKKLQDRAVVAILGMDPMRMKAFGVDPRAAFEAWCRTMRLVPTEFQYSAEKQKEIDSQPQPKSDVVQAAEIRAQATIQAAQSRDQLTIKKIEADTDRDTEYTRALSERTSLEHQQRQEEMALRRELAMLDYANRHQITLDQVKAKLASDTMKLQVQKELAGVDGRGPQVATPPTEPPGRAPAGEAYQR